MSVKENGPWHVVDAMGHSGKVYIQSEDFTHDAILVVGGDFANAIQRMEYANEIARRLNAMNPKEPS